MDWIPDLTNAGVMIITLMALLTWQISKGRAETRKLDAETKAILSSLSSTASATIDQVRNSHTESNLRDDIDQIISRTTRIERQLAEHLESTSGYRQYLDTILEKER